MTAIAAVTRRLGGEWSAALATRTRWPRPETALVVLVALMVLVAHDVGYVFRQAFWQDEDWVAITTRFPLSDLAQTTSSTPIGWSFLLRLVPSGHPEALRIVPMLFSMATVVVAYVLVHRLPWPNRWVAAGAGLIAAVVALLVPAMLKRDDLKQYTADAAIALLVLAATSRYERDSSRRNLALLGSAVVVGMLFSHAAAFLGVAAFVCVVGAALIRRAWRAAAETAVAGAATAIAMGVVYVAFDKRAVNKGLTDYWRNYYVPFSHGPHETAAYLHNQWTGVGKYFGLGPFWVAFPLFVAGVLTLARLNRLATALTPVVLVVEMIVLSGLKKYPFLDLRTSTFLFVVVSVVAAIGVVGIAVAASRWARPVLAAGMVVVCLGLFILDGSAYAREQTIPNEPLRDQIRYVAAHRAPTDVILVSAPSAAGFAFYWPHGHPGIVKSHANLQGYVAVLPDQEQVVTAMGRDDASVLAALEQARSRASSAAAGGAGARIWLIRSHQNLSEGQAWRLALRAVGWVGTATGPRGLVLLSPAALG